jgi:N-acetylglutamate synthase
VTDRATVRALQERAARAQPAERIEPARGWWLRHNARGAWWLGSVLPHRDVGPDELRHRVAAAEAFYAAHDAVARFQISPGACPSALDALLAARGYRRESPMSLQTAATADVVRPAALRVDIDDRPTRAWFDVWAAVHGHGDDPNAEWAMLARVRAPAAYARAMVGGEAVAVGRAVADTGWAGVFGMATLPAARGAGAGRALLAALAAWAGAHRADRLYLQVESGNGPARRLYERVGFTEICGYHYRAR